MKIVYIVLRALVGAVWGGCAAIAISVSNGFVVRLHSAESAPQQCAVCAMTLVDLMLLYVIARALDRILTVAADEIWKRLHRGELRHVSAPS